MSTSTSTNDSENSIVTQSQDNSISAINNTVKFNKHYFYLYEDQQNAQITISHQSQRVHDAHINPEVSNSGYMTKNWFYLPVLENFSKSDSVESLIGYSSQSAKGCYEECSTAYIVSCRLDELCDVKISLTPLNSILSIYCAVRDKIQAEKASFIPSELDELGYPKSTWVRVVFVYDDGSTSAEGFCLALQEITGFTKLEDLMIEGVYKNKERKLIKAKYLNNEALVGITACQPELWSLDEFQDKYCAEHHLSVYDINFLLINLHLSTKLSVRFQLNRIDRTLSYFDNSLQIADEESPHALFNKIVEILKLEAWTTQEQKSKPMILCEIAADIFFNKQRALFLKKAIEKEFPSYEIEYYQSHENTFYVLDKRLSQKEQLIIIQRLETIIETLPTLENFL